MSIKIKNNNNNRLKINKYKPLQSQAAFLPTPKPLEDFLYPANGPSRVYFLPLRTEGAAKRTLDKCFSMHRAAMDTWPTPNVPQPLLLWHVSCDTNRNASMIMINSFYIAARTPFRYFFLENYLLDAQFFAYPIEEKTLVSHVIPKASRKGQGLDSSPLHPTRNLIPGIQEREKEEGRGRRKFFFLFLMKGLEHCQY